jgi:Lysylphosphatidylglycerol synthase TM region
MVTGWHRQWRSILPWVVSAALLFYTFGYATQWSRLVDALEHADVPRFLLFASVDRLAFFVMWTWLSASALRRFVAEVRIGSVFAIRGGSELARAVSNPLSDAAYVLGLARLCGGRLDAVVASTLVPVVSHLFAMLVQMTIALPFQEGGIGAVRGVAIIAGVMWLLVAALLGGVALVRSGRLRSRWLTPVNAWLERFPLREIAPYLWGFGALAIFDVHIQWLASRAFGVHIDWTAMAARLPLLYLTFIVPTFGNFGTRELTWAALFDEFADRDALVAYAFSINAIFLVLNVLIGVIFLSRALELIGAVRRARREGEAVPRPVFGDPTDP